MLSRVLNIYHYLSYLLIKHSLGETKYTGVFIEGVPKDELLALEYKWTSLQNRIDQSE